MSKPEVSVIICTYNREKYISQALESILRQQAPQHSYELIVVDNNSTDASGRIIQDLISAHPGRPWHYILEKEQGLSYARNTGIAHAKGDIITFIDDDAIARPDFVDNVIRFFSAHPEADAMGGKVIPKFVEGRPEWLSWFTRKVVSEIDFGPAVKELKKKYPFGANMSFRREALERSGDFDTALGRKGSSLLGGEEKDLFDRMKGSGSRIFYDPEVVVQHIIPPQRLSPAYIEHFCKGVGRSERIRLKNKGAGDKFGKWVFNKAKRLGSIGLGIAYTLAGQRPKGKMIMDVMRWIEEGYAEGKGNKDTKFG